MPTINIQRTKEYNNKLRNYLIFIDEIKVGELANGENKEFTIAPGNHRVKAKIDWCSSPEISILIVDNETKNLKVGGFKFGKWLMPITFVILIIHGILKVTSGINGAIFLLIPTFLLTVYYLTFGRNKYLTITEL